MSKKVFIPNSKISLLKENNNDFASQDKYKLNTGTGLEKGHVVNDSVIQEVDSDEINLSSFKLQHSLVPELWKNGKLDSKVRLRLLDIADDFWDSMDITWAKPKGHILTGSICNYNWSKYSDIDLHIIVDFKDVDKRVDFVEEYFNSKKNTWNNEHDNLNIYGYKVELYVEDIDADTESGGLYDLDENDWLQKPDPDELEPISSDKDEIKDISSEFMTEIDDLIEKSNSTDDTHILEELSDKAEELLSIIQDTRKKGLKDGEMGVGNIVYKVLRRAGYLDKLWDLISDLYDSIYSISESVNEEVVADGNADHNPFAERWKHERNVLKDFIINNGVLMTSKENGKTYKVYNVTQLANLLGYNYALCLEFDPSTMKEGSTVYIRALDKFTRRLFQAQFDTRGRDNKGGTSDDIR